MVVRSHSNSHHTIEGESQERSIHEEEVPKELSSGPLEPYHRIHYETVHHSLHKNVRHLYEDLGESIRHGGVHSGGLFSVKDCSLYVDHWLH